jgi:hypothetical protein
MIAGSDVALADHSRSSAWTKVPRAWRDRGRSTLGVGYALFVAKLHYRIPVLPLVFVLAGVGGRGSSGRLSPHSLWEGPRRVGKGWNAALDDS